MTARAIRFVVSAALLVLVSRFVDVGEVVGRLATLEPGWVLLGLAISVAQVPVLAWRWVYTARRLGIELGWARAVSEYWLGVLANQILPGGITGDVSRAWRHARTDAPPRGAVVAVVLERASAQVVMTSAAILSLLTLPWAPIGVRIGAGAAVFGMVWLFVRRARLMGAGGMDGVRGDVHTALLDTEALPVQVVSALLVVGSYLAVFLIAGRAVGVDTPLLHMLPLVAPVLMTMLLPVSVAGWGVREAAAASLWGLVGLSPADGTAISVAYGLIVLASALPGVMTLMIGNGDRGRTGRPDRA